MSQVEETTNPQGPHIPIERVQTGARMEKNSGESPQSIGRIF